MTPWDNWEDQKQDKVQSVEEYRQWQQTQRQQSEEPEPETNYFQDMTPKLKKQKKVWNIAFYIGFSTFKPKSRLAFMGQKICSWTNVVNN